MADKPVTPVILSKDTVVDVGAGTGALAANDVVYVNPVAAVAPNGTTGAGGSVAVPLKGRYLLLHITGGGAEATFTVAKGVQGQTPANLAHGQEDLVFTVGTTQVRYIQLELAKYLQADGSVKITVTGASATPTLRAVQLSKAA
jgi:hypothetical protein